MEKIRLSKNEKKVLRLLQKHGSAALDTMSRSSLRQSLRSLEAEGLVRVAWVEGGGFVDAMLTRMGSDYFIENPRLRNPIDWKWWAVFLSGLIAAIGASAGFIALLRTCS